VPKEVSEISSGQQFSRSAGEGELADSYTRSFRIIRQSVDEIVDIQEACQVYIGDVAPYNSNIYCLSFDARFEGDSRMVITATFNYQTTPSGGGGGGEDPKSVSPDVRPANWTIGSSLYEVPLHSFFGQRTGQQQWGGPEALKNSANDMYDGVATFDALVTISITQFEAIDPTKHASHVGAINSEQITLGSLQMSPHTVMFRGLSCQPTVESWGTRLFRGWNCTYEFAYKANFTNIHFGANGADGLQLVELGWDIALPQTGFNVKAFAPPGDAAVDEVFAQPLAHHEGKVVKGDFDANGKFTPNPASEFRLPFQTTPGEKVRGMVKVYEYETGGTSQLPCAQPIPLNDSGRPRKSGLMPLVYGYQVHRAIDLTKTLGLRLF